MIKIEMSFETAGEAAAALAAIQGNNVKTLGLEPPAPGVYSEEQFGNPRTGALSAGAQMANPLPNQAPQSKAEAPKEEKPSSPPPVESAAPGVTYDDLKASIMKLVAKNPTEMKKVCEAFGLKTFAGTTDPVLWAKAKAMIDAKVAG